MRNRLRSAGLIYLTKLTLRHLVRVLTGSEKGTLCLDEIGPQQVEKFIGARRAKVKAKSVNRELGNLRATFNRAVKLYRMLEKNPFAGIEMLPVDEKPIRPLSSDEEAALLAACAGDIELDVYVRLALDTGCRAGELSHLRWKSLDIDAGTGLLESTTDWRTKTRKSRYIAFTEETARRLRRWRMRRPRKEHVFMEKGEPSRGHYDRIRNKFMAAAKRAGIQERTLHDLRRTVASLLAAQGVNQKVAAEYLGHSDIRTTARYYQAVSKETIHETVNRLRPEDAG